MRGKYNMALDKAKEYYETANDTEVCEQWNELQSEFKRINEAFENGKNEVINRPEAFGLQKEQKPAEWSEEDKETLNGIIRSVNGFDAVTGIIPQDFKQHEKKINWLEHLPERFNLQPKVEWGEDDKTRLKVIKEELEKYIMFKQYGTPLSVDDISWLESLPERSNPLPKQEWNEEDILNLDNIIWLCENCEKGIETTWIPSQATKIKHLIKSIKESSVQKQEWSEEDKEYLAACIDVIDNFYTISGELKTLTKINVLRREYAEKLKSWLKSLPERFNFQSKQEWSEEDENMLNKCISRMTDIIPVTGKSGGIKDMTFETRTEMELVKWLKKKFNR